MLANNEDPDHMPHYVASDLGLNCLPMTLLWDSYRRRNKKNIPKKSYQMLNAYFFSNKITALPVTIFPSNEINPHISGTVTEPSLNLLKEQKCRRHNLRLQNLQNWFIQAISKTRGQT